MESEQLTLLKSFMVSLAPAILDENWAEARRVLMINPIFLSDQLLDILEQVNLHLVKEDDYDAAWAGRCCICILRRCNTIGIWHAIAEAESFGWTRFQALLSELEVPLQPERVRYHIWICERGIELVNKQKAPHIWANFHSELAMALSQSQFGNHKQNLEQAISHFQTALDARAREIAPNEWAKSAANLAITYVQRIKGNRRDNLMQAITYYEQALQVLDKEEYPELWAHMTTSLADLFLKLEE